MAGSASASVSTRSGDRWTVKSFLLHWESRSKRRSRHFSALGTAYYHISRLNLKTKKIELVKRSRKMDLGILKIILQIGILSSRLSKDIIAEPFVQKYIDFFDIQTMAARLHNKESMSSEFKKKDGIMVSFHGCSSEL